MCIRDRSDPSHFPTPSFTMTSRACFQSHHDLFQTISSVVLTQTDFVCVSCDVDVLDGERIDDVADFPFIVRCRWRSSGRNRDDIQAYIVTVECQQRDAGSDSATSCASLVDAVRVAVQSMHKCLSIRGINNCQSIGGLRAFARTDCFSAADLCQG